MIDLHSCDELAMQRIVRRRIVLRQIVHATNSPRRTVRNELSCDELSGHRIIVLRYLESRGPTTLLTSTFRSTSTEKANASSPSNGIATQSAHTLHFDLVSLVLNKNFIINGDAESGPCEIASYVTHPTIWSYDGPITQIYYNNTDIGGLTISSPGPT